MQGFACTYEFAVENRGELITLCKDLKNVMSRVVLRQTQLYVMYLNTSCHPAFMTDIVDREIFLGQLACDLGRDQFSEKIVQKEIDDLLNGDIPVFYSKGADRWLYDSNERKIVLYFNETGYEILQKKIKTLCKNDREQQVRNIQMSLELSENGPEAEEEKYIILNSREDSIRNAVCFLYEELEKTAVKSKDDTEITWISAFRESRNGKKWNVRPCDIYLYQGLAGIAQFVWAYEMIMKNDSFYLGGLVKNTLFTYTDKAFQDKNFLQSESTGAFAGEASLIQAYLSLYAISGKKEFLEYAEKHAELLEALLPGDTAYDLMSGNAGAVLVLLNLFKTAKKKKYLVMAEMAAEILFRHKIENEYGIGWIISGQEQILTGLSHGESGFALAFYRLYQETGKKRYADIVKKIITYEDHLYSASHNNWLDYRGRRLGESGEDLVAWCHGAAGILAARHQMEGMDFYKISEDRDNAIIKTMKSLNRKGWCLCHGKLGNAFILQEVLGKNFHTDLWTAAAKIILDDKLDPVEKYNMGFMTGISGIGYGLLTQLDKNLKANILFCKDAF